MTTRGQQVEQLVHLYGGRLYAFCRRLTLSQNDADDLYQMTYLRVLDMSENVDSTINPPGFLMAVATRIWQDEIRKSARRHRIAPLQQAYDGQMDTIVDQLSSVEEQVNLKEVQIMIKLAVEQLPDALRIPTLLYYMGDLSVRQISEELAIPQGTVKSRLYHARQTLKQELEVRGYGAGS